MAADLHHAHLLAVFVAEKLHHVGASADLGVGNYLPTHRRVAENTLVDQLFDLGHLLRSKRRTAEVEGQLVRTNITALLHRLGSDHFVQRPMQKVRHRVMTLDGRPTRQLDAQLHFGAHLRRLLACEHMQPNVTRFLRSDDAPKLAAGAQFAGITDLAAHLRVTNAAIKHDRKLALEIHHLENFGAHGELIVTEKLGRFFCRHFGNRDDLLFLRRPRPRALLFHQAFELRLVHRQSAFPRHQSGQVERESLFVIKPESKCTGNFLPDFQAGRFGLEQRNAFVQRPVESLLFPPKDVLDLRLFAAQFGKNLAHRRRQHGG